MRSSLRCPRTDLLLWTLVPLLLAAPSRAQNQPSFEGLGSLHPTIQDSEALAVSADGNVVVGASRSSAGQEAFRWTPGGGMQGLGDLSGGDVFSVASGVSADGNVVVGAGTIGTDSSRAFRSVAPFTSLTQLPNFSCSISCPDVAAANGVSPDGNTVVGVGSDRPLFGDPFYEAARWVGGSFSINGLGFLSGGGVASSAKDISAAGVIVGDSDSSSGTRAFVRPGSSLVALPAIVASRPGSSANAISSDGTVIVGFANTETDGGLPANAEAVYWTQSNPGVSGFDTVTEIGRLPGATVAGSRARAVSGDGSIIVGVANDEVAMDVAFVWDAVHGIRPLKEVLEQEYGLDLTGWILDQATGVSDVNAADEFVIVGLGTNPDGDPEGFRAVLSPTECNDGVDNDLDGQIDYPADPECLAKGDRSETEDCSDGLDNDGDGDIDYPADTECLSATDLSETPDCSDGVDNDGDGLVDFPADPGCRYATSSSEITGCDNGLDDDGDGKIDYPEDPECLAGDDASEVRDCNDGLDNDGDGFTDYPADTECTGPNDPAEDPECSDRLDNDLDGRRDWPEAYPACTGPDDVTEAAQCSDGIDNDGDGQIDYPADTGCLAADAQLEAHAVVSVGDLLAVGAKSRRLFVIHPATGAQALVSKGALMASPQGVAVRSSGEIVVADASGLIQVDPVQGTQRLFSGPLSANESLQVVFDGSGNAVVLTSSGLTGIDWVYGGTSPSTTLFTVPTPEPSPNILGWVGDSLVRETSGDYVVTGIGALGDGPLRIDGTTFVPSGIAGGFTFARWYDLAVESDGHLLAVGQDFPVVIGLFRIDPVTGARTALSTGATWTSPVAVAVDGAGDIFVSDAGTCDSQGVCTGAKVVRVDPNSGATLDVWTGGYIDGPLDLAVVRALTACSDGIDNDADGSIDYPADLGCTAPSDSTELPQCADGLDNDGDGGIDTADLGCQTAFEGSRENPITSCNDDLDNDNDGLVDWDGGNGSGAPDPQCLLKPWASSEKKKCGLGFELVLGLGAALALGRRAVRARPAPRG